MLSSIGSREAIDVISSLNIPQLENELRECIARELGQTGWIAAPEHHKVEAMLSLLAKDEQPFVAGAACASYCTHSIGDEEFLAREKLWQLVDQLSVDALLYFFSSTYDDYLFEERDTAKVLSYAKRLPGMASSFAWLLHEMGDESAATYMRSHLTNGESKLWALAYFARCPSKLAESTCEELLAEPNDLNESILAASCLSQLGSKSATRFLTDRLANPGVYAWISSLGSNALEQALTTRASRADKSRINAVLKKVQG